MQLKPARNTRSHVCPALQLRLELGGTARPLEALEDRHIPILLVFVLRAFLAALAHLVAIAAPRLRTLKPGMVAIILYWIGIAIQINKYRIALISGIAIRIGVLASPKPERKYCKSYWKIL